MCGCAKEALVGSRIAGRGHGFLFQRGRHRGQLKSAHHAARSLDGVDDRAEVFIVRRMSGLLQQPDAAIRIVEAQGVQLADLLACEHALEAAVDGFAQDTGFRQFACTGRVWLAFGAEFVHAWRLTGSDCPRVSVLSALQ